MTRGTKRYDLSGDAVGWGINLSAGVTVAEMDRIHAQFAYGQGIENYMNDATVDVGIKQLTGPPPTDLNGRPRYRRADPHDGHRPFL